MRAILIAIACTLAASAAHPGDQYSEGNQRRGEEPDAPVLLASEASSRSNKSLQSDHVLTSLEVLQLSGLLNDPIPRAQRGDIEVVEEPTPDDRGDVPGSILYGHVSGRSKRDIRSSRKLLSVNKQADVWGFGEDDGLVNDQPSSDEDDQQQHIKRPMNHHHNHHRQEEYRRGQESLRRAHEQIKRPEEEFRRSQDQSRRPEEDRAVQDQRRRQWEEEQRRRQQEEQRRRQEEEQRRRVEEEQRRRPDEEQRRVQEEERRRRPEEEQRRRPDEEQRRVQEEERRRRPEEEPRRRQEDEQRRAQEEERRRQWEQSRRAPENQRIDPNSRKTEAPPQTYEERLKEWQRMKDEYERSNRAKENARKNPNHREDRTKTEEEFENERKLQEYIRRNTPINLSRYTSPENLTRPYRPDPNRPSQSDNVSKSGRPENVSRPDDDPRKEDRRHRGQYDPEEVRRRQEEQQRRIEHERRLQEEARTRSPPVNNQHQENERVRLAEAQRQRDQEEARRRLNQQQGRIVEDQRNRPNAYIGHRIPSPVDERRRPEDPMSHLRPTPNPDDHQRTIRPDDPASQHHENPDQNWSPGRRYPMRPENAQPDRSNWWRQRPEDEARRQEIAKCRRLLEDEERRRKEEEDRRRQPSRPNQPGQPRPEDDDRYYEHKRNEAKVPWPPGAKNETDEERQRRLRGLPVEATIIVRADGSNNTYDSPVALTLRQGFGDEIDFTGFSPAKAGAAAASFPSPVTQHPPARSPPSCIWALVVCCRGQPGDGQDPRVQGRIRRCFEATNCLAWDNNRCGPDNVRAANEALMNFYVVEQARTSRPLVYQFEE